jgi:hypothetical protein
MIDSGEIIFRIHFDTLTLMLRERNKIIHNKLFSVMNIDLEDYKTCNAVTPEWEKKIV